MAPTTARRPKKSATLTKIEKENRKLEKLIREAEEQAEKYKTEEAEKRQKIDAERKPIIDELRKERLEILAVLRPIEEENEVEKKAIAKVEEAILELKKEQIVLSDTIEFRKECLDVTKRPEKEAAKKKKIEFYERRISAVQEAHKEFQQRGDHGGKFYNICEECGQEFTAGPERCPLFLGCGHTFCASCIEILAKPNAVICPFDEKVTLIEKSQLHMLIKNYNVPQM